MTQINQSSVSRDSIKEAYAFYLSIFELTGMLTMPELKPAIQAYVEAFEALKKTIDNADGESLAAAAKKADDERDGAWVGANAYLRCMANYYPEIPQRESAKVLFDIFTKYGNPTGLSFAAETTVLDNLIDDIEKKMDDVRNCAFEVWLNTLKTKHRAYLDATIERAGKESQKVLGAVKTARTATETAYQTLVTLVNAYSIVANSEQLEGFAAQTNYFIDARRVAAKKVSSTKASKAMEETPEVEVEGT